MDRLNPYAEAYQPCTPQQLQNQTQEVGLLYDKSPCLMPGDESDPLDLLQLSLDQKTFVLLWRSDTHSDCQPVDRMFPVEIAAHFSSYIADNMAITTEVVGHFDHIFRVTEPIIVTGGSRDSLIKLTGWMLACCQGNGMIRFPSNVFNPVLSAFSDLQMAHILGMQFLIPFIEEQIKLGLLSGGRIPLNEIRSRLEYGEMVPGEYEFLAEHIAGHIFQDMETRFRERINDPETQNSQGPRRKLPSDIYFDLRFNFPAFDEEINAFLSSKVQAARAERGKAMCERAQPQKPFHPAARIHQEQTVPAALRAVPLQQGRNIGKAKAGKVDVADLGISIKSLAGARDDRRGGK